MHVHVVCADGEAKFWLQPEVEMAKNHHLTAKQLVQIQDHIECAKGQDWKDEGGFYADAWNVEIDGDNVRASTFMDNFDMGSFLQKIGVLDDAVRWGHDAHLY